jgi:hypothetical protein
MPRTRSGGERVFVLQPAELALDGSATLVEVAEPPSVTRG